MFSFYIILLKEDMSLTSVKSMYKVEKVDVKL